MSEMGKAMMGTGEAEGEKRAIEAAEAAISNPLLDDVSMRGARGVLINITGGLDMTLYEVDAAANRIREEVDSDANIIFGSTFDNSLQGRMRVSVVSTGIDLPADRATAAQAPIQEPVAEPARVVSGGFRFQPQRAQAVPYPAQGARPAARRPGEISPATHLRAATDLAAEPAPVTADAEAVPDGVPIAAPARSEERAGNLFARVKEFAFTRTAERPVERHPPRFGERAPRPGADGQPALSASQDELGDIPSFLRRERERVDG
jgi:cell division protein FtsZ